MIFLQAGRRKSLRTRESVFTCMMFSEKSAMLVTADRGPAARFLRFSDSACIEMR